MGAKHAGFTNDTGPVVITPFHGVAIGLVVVVLTDCSKQTSPSDHGGEGGSAGAQTAGSESGASGGSAGSAGIASSGGTSSGGTSSGGTSAGGTSSGGTSAGGTSSGGTAGRSGSGGSAADGGGSGDSTGGDGGSSGEVDCSKVGQTLACVPGQVCCPVIGGDNRCGEDCSGGPTLSCDGPEDCDDRPCCFGGSGSSAETHCASGSTCTESESPTCDIFPDCPSGAGFICCGRANVNGTFVFLCSTSAAACME